MKKENALRTWIRQSLKKNYCCFLQPSLGSTPGQPDVLVIEPTSGLFAPIELKVTQRLLNGNLRPLMLRPVQIAWHTLHQEAGGKSFLLLGVHEAAGWNCWLLADCSYEVLASWKRGFPLERLVRVATDGKLASDAWWRALRGALEPVAAHAAARSD